MKKSIAALLLCAAIVAARATSVGAQQTAEFTSPSAAGAAGLDSLIARALTVNPSIRAAESRLDAARAGIGPAGALSDPMLMAGVMNQPLRGPTPDMTMRAIGVSQTLPFPGKLGLARTAAEHERDAVGAELEGVRRTVVSRVKQAYYEIAFLDRSIDVLARSEQLLGGFLSATEARYGVGMGSQADVLKARVELARLPEEGAALQESRHAATARLNALLDRPSEIPVAAASIPDRIARAAIAREQAIRFTSSALDGRVADSPLPSLAILQATAVQENADLRAQDARIAAQAARVELARRAHLPDFDVALQYGQRSGGRADLVSATVSVPIPVHRSGRQGLELVEAQETLAGLAADREARANEVRAEVAAAYAGLDRARTQLALFAKSILPQGSAALEAATASFQVGRGDFLSLVESQSTLYQYEIAYHRALTDFADRLAELEALVGKEVLP